MSNKTWEKLFKKKDKRNEKNEENEEFISKLRE